MKMALVFIKNFDSKWNKPKINDGSYKLRIRIHSHELHDQNNIIDLMFPISLKFVGTF